jgi:hypothetical protein
MVRRREQEQEISTRNLKALAKELNVPVSAFPIRVRLKHVDPVKTAF